jgi:energy-coupling factor transporter ATP-binding protein EcfA2
MSDKTIISLIVPFVKVMEGLAKSKKNTGAISHIIDVSGSTNDSFNERTTILQKEVDCLLKNILGNPDLEHHLYSFDENPIFLGIFCVLDEFVELPYFRPGSYTYTAKAFKLLLDNIKSGKISKPSNVYLYTDGDTNSPERHIKEYVKELNNMNIKIHIIAITSSNTNLETITQNEEQKIPGMDLVNYCINLIDSLNIYNKFHNEIPFNGVQNSRISSSSLSFMDIELPTGTIIPKFINDIINIVGMNPDIIWGMNNIDLKKFCSQIGKLISVLFVSFPEDHSFIFDISLKISNLGILTREEIIKFIEYGFNCVKQNRPIKYTNIDGNIKDASVKKQEFSDALQFIARYGSTLNCNRSICFPKNGYSIIQTTKESTDSTGNTFFGIDADPQALRIAIRAHCGSIGFQNARQSPSVIFYVLSEMSMMFIHGIPLDCEHMIEFRKMAIIQTSMVPMIANGKYASIGFFDSWKQGEIPKMHYSSPKTHSYLSSDEHINPLKLPEPIWWILMMTMLGLFDIQVKFVKDAIVSLGIDLNEESFLTYIRSTYGTSIEGNIVLKKFEPLDNSVFTLSEFPEGITIHRFKDHGLCRTNTCYSDDELPYLYERGCVWCSHIPQNDSDFETFQNISNTSLEGGIPLKIKDFARESTADALSLDSLSLCVGSKNVIFLVGPTGCGKSTSSEKMSSFLQSKGASVLIVSADKWSKKSMNPGNEINRELVSFDRNNNPFKVIIIDLCNEKGPDMKAFRFDFARNGYTKRVFYPNMDKNKFYAFKCWCLKNLLMRPLHDETTNFWLNPVSAGLQTVLKVHNMKCRTLEKTLQIHDRNPDFSGSSIPEILGKIEIYITEYEEFLETINLDNEISKFLNEII